MKIVIALLTALTVNAHATNMQTSCVVANERCFTLRAAAGRLTSRQRIDLVNDRLAYILGYENPRKVRLIPSAGGVGIYVGRSLLVTVMSADALANGLYSPEVLARIWAANLRHTLPLAIPMSRLHR